MGERLRLHPVAGGRAMDMGVTRREQFTAGGDSTKYLVIGADGRRYVERPYFASVVESQQRFKTAGFRVPEFYRGSDGQLYAEDLRADGSEIYGKSLVHALSDPNYQREPHPADARFLQVMQSNQRGANKKIRRNC